MKTAVLNITPGNMVRYHNEPCIVLEHRTDGTLLVVQEQIEYIFGSTNNFATSDLYSHLNGPYLDTLTGGITDEIISRTIDLTALNGSKEYGTVEAKIAPLTLDELRKYHGILPNPARWEWSATPWSTPCVNDDGEWVLSLGSGGNLGDYNCANVHGAHPAFLIPSRYTVETAARDALNSSLEEYSNRDLLDELYRRLNAKG